MMEGLGHRVEITIAANDDGVRLDRAVDQVTACARKQFAQRALAVRAESVGIDIERLAGAGCNVRKQASYERFGVRRRDDREQYIGTREFGLEFEAKLFRFIVREPARHLREDGAVEPDLAWLPRHDLSRARLREQSHQIATHLVRIGAIDVLRPVLQQFGLRIGHKQIGLPIGRHGVR